MDLDGAQPIDKQARTRNHNKYEQNMPTKMLTIIKQKWHIFKDLRAIKKIYTHIGGDMAKTTTRQFYIYNSRPPPKEVQAMYKNMKLIYKVVKKGQSFNPTT